MCCLLKGAGWKTELVHGVQQCEKCDAHPLGRNNPNHLDRLQNNGLGNSFEDQELSILVVRRWTWASSAFSWQRGPIVFGLHSEMSSVGCDPALCSALMRHIWTAGHNSALLCTKSMDLLEEVTKMLEAKEYSHIWRNWEHWGCLAWGKGGSGEVLSVYINTWCRRAKQWAN